MRLHLNDVEDVTENIILTGRSLREMRLRLFSPQGGPYCQGIGVKMGGMNRWDTVSYKKIPCYAVVVDTGHCTCIKSHRMNTRDCDFGLWLMVTIQYWLIM